jgi:hypothetical protein
MHHRSPTIPDPRPDALTLASATWLACGVVLLGLTPLPLHDPISGWSPAFWLVGAPLVLLMARRLCMPGPRLRPVIRRRERPTRGRRIQAVRRRGCRASQNAAGDRTLRAG